MMTQKIGFYYSLNENCPHIFSTVFVEDTFTFPYSLIRDCFSCNKTHSFKYSSSYLVNTPRQRALMQTYSKKIGVIEENVIV